MKQKSVFAVGVAMSLAGCGQSSENSAANQTAANEAAQAAAKPKAPHCFFKDAEMKGWAASREKATGNLVVKGKAYRSDPRYKAVIGKTAVEDGKAIVWPNIEQNTGYAAPDNWWDLSATVPDTAALDTVDVKCGDKLVTELKVPARKS